MQRATINGIGTIRAEFGTDALLAIRPEHAEKIFCGEKLYELRKVCPKTVPRRLYLWVTGKGGGVVGQVVVSEVLYGDPKSLWHEVGNQATTKERFQRYFAGERIAYAIRVESVIRFPRTLTTADIREVWPRATVPRNFVYMDLAGELSRKLEALSFSCVFTSRGNSGGVHVRPIQKQEYNDFRRHVVEHIGSAYLETGAAYADHLIQSHESGFDHDGVFTTRKWVCALESQGALVGFTVLTAKIGGSVKTGPTMIDATQRNHGIGVKIRSVIHSNVAKLGYRKVYCTVPVIRPAAIRYLLNAGYRVEADLDRQYHYSHRELVLGWDMSRPYGGGQRRERSPSEFVRIQRMRKKSEARECERIFREAFGEVYCGVSDCWASRQLEKAVKKDSENRYTKPVSIYKAEDADGVAGFVFCVWKRGGAVKLCPVILRGTDGDIVTLIKYAIDGIKRQRQQELRKFYAHITPEDGQLVRAVQNLGLTIEGCIRKPYTSSQDMLVMGGMFECVG